jgi:hypothetical protein
MLPAICLLDRRLILIYVFVDHSSHLLVGRSFGHDREYTKNRFLKAAHFPDFLIVKVNLCARACSNRSRCTGEPSVRRAPGHTPPAV